MYYVNSKLTVNIKIVY